MTIWIIYLALGAAAGILAGLFGVGGGLIIVPMLTFTFTAQHLPPEYILHLALGTSLATIVFTSISSLRAHHRRQGVLWPVVIHISPGIIFGTFAGSWIASCLSTGLLKGFFVCFTFYVAMQLLLDIRPKPSRQLPVKGVIFGAGALIGGVSSLVGIGGGSLSVPFLVWCNVPVHSAIGTSAAIGFPIAIAGTCGYLLSGLHASGLPHGAIGYIYLPALTGIAAASCLTAPLGARLAHLLPVSGLKKGFALLLLITGVKMLSSLL